MKTTMLVALAFTSLLGCSEEPVGVLHCDAVAALSKCYEYASDSAHREGTLCRDSGGTQSEGPCPQTALVGRCFDESKAPEGSVAATWVAQVALKHTDMVPAYYSTGKYPYSRESAGKDCAGVGMVLR